MEQNYKQKKLRDYVRPNNKKAPRMGKAEFSYNLISRELYENWKTEFPQYKELSFLQFKETWSKIAKQIWEDTCTNTDGVRLPFYTGDVAIKYVKRYVPPVEDISSELGYEIEELNWNTNGKLGKVVWSIDYSRKFNKACKIFCFHPFVEFSLRSHKALLENPEIFKSNRVGRSNLKKMIGNNDKDKQGVHLSS